eukprot:4463081-Prymnesium_polylepis.1
MNAAYCCGRGLANKVWSAFHRAIASARCATASRYILLALSERCCSRSCILSVRSSKASVSVRARPKTSSFVGTRASQRRPDDLFVAAGTSSSAITCRRPRWLAVEDG